MILRHRAGDALRPLPTSTRPAEDGRYRSARWRGLRLIVLAREPLCRACGAAAATDVDHVAPVASAEDPAFWREANLQPLCHSCHARKTATADGGFGRGPHLR